jgi:hypothetical protein
MTRARLLTQGAPGPHLAVPANAAVYGAAKPALIAPANQMSDVTIFPHFSLAYR